MRGVGLSLKAVFLVFLVISISFFHTGSVQAEEQNVCCEQTISGDSCVYTSESNCDPDSLQASTSCEQTSFCKAGCCISDVGKCSKGVAQATCDNIEGYSWQEGSACEVDACEKNCCVIAESQCSYTTEAHCEVLIQDLEDIVLDWRAVDSESACTDICKAADKGCCVTGEGCTYDSYAMCDSPDIDLTEGTGFYENTYCSEMGSCGCTAGDSYACVDEDVYSFDSCGNQEEIFEDCDYAEGNWCGTDASGEVGCLSTDCSDTFDGVYSVNDVITERNIHDDKIGGEREHGESWCLYESPAGGWFDRPGSQHYRAFCYFGEEIIEPCEDYREKVCIQYPYTNYFEYTIMDAIERPENSGPSEHYWSDGISAGDSYTSVSEAGSACIDNGVYQDLINANVTTVPKGSDLSADSSSSADTCSVANLECPVTYAKESHTAEWKCIYNCHCLTPEFADQAAGFCASRGDCGAKLNLAGDYVSDGFYITRSQDNVSTMTGYFGQEIKDVTRTAAYVGMDEGCRSEFSVEGDNEDCIDDCKVSSDNPSGCEFYSEMREEVKVQLDDASGGNYGVYGGMVGFSKSLSSLAGTDYVKGKTLATIGYITGAVGLLVAYTVLTASAGAYGLSTILGTIALSTSAVPFVGWIVAAVAIVILVITYTFTGGGEVITVTISSNCQPWQAPAGTENCELCDTPVSQGGLALDDGNGIILTGYECTEYKCNSLGAGCQYLSENQGTTRTKCVGIESNDVNHPVVEKYMVDVSDSTTEGLIDTDGYVSTSVDDYAFAEDHYLNFNSKVDPYQSVTFGIETDEPSQCKIQQGGEVPSDYFTMSQFFPDSYIDYTHNQTWILTPNEKFTFYVRCWDRARDDGNVHEDFFQIQIETTDGEDITPPSIEATSVRNGAYVPAGVNDTLLTVYVDEPAYCKWSQTDSEYSLMENYFACAGIPSSASAYFDNECTTVLNVTEATNYYYFACQDQAGNSNTENYPFTLLATAPLDIDSVSPSGILYTDYTTLAVQTTGGAESGKAICSYDGIAFFDTNSSYHQQSLEDLGAGEYLYDILCQDVAGNQNTSEISFSVEVDIDVPELLSIYKQESTVYYTLDEEASCEYYFEDFSYGSGTSISSMSSSGSFSLTEIQEYSLKCEDVFGNEGSWIVRV